MENRISELVEVWELATWYVAKRSNADEEMDHWLQSGRFAEDAKVVLDDLLAEGVEVTFEEVETAARIAMREFFENSKQPS